MQTQQQAREEFANYWEALKTEYGSDAGIKREVWERFIGHKVEEELLPREALGWRMPRSTRA